MNNKTTCPVWCPSPIILLKAIEMPENETVSYAGDTSIKNFGKQALIMLLQS